MYFSTTGRSCIYFLFVFTMGEVGVVDVRLKGFGRLRMIGRISFNVCLSKKRRKRVLLPAHCMPRSYGLKS